MGWWETFKDTFKQLPYLALIKAHRLFLYPAIFILAVALVVVLISLTSTKSTKVDEYTKSREEIIAFNQACGGRLRYSAWIDDSTVYTEKNSFHIHLKEISLNDLPKTVPFPMYVSSLHIYGGSAPSTPTETTELANKLARVLEAFRHCYIKHLELRNFDIEFAPAPATPRIRRQTPGAITFYETSSSFISWFGESVQLLCPNRKLALNLMYSANIKSLECLDSLGIAGPIKTLLVMDLPNLESLGCRVLNNTGVAHKIYLFNLSSKVEVPASLARNIESQARNIQIGFDIYTKLTMHKGFCLNSPYLSLVLETYEELCSHPNPEDLGTRNPYVTHIYVSQPDAPQETTKEVVTQIVEWVATRFSDVGYVTIRSNTLNLPGLQSFIDQAVFYKERLPIAKIIIKQLQPYTIDSLTTFDV
ncbi:hypothetical protein NEDG_01714 [Nematocida displodere]|uniref:Uncharacterized protein n=1 Tax=Nematocida displodere TaxID=1805483 RepID=A0A177EF64_9MICR|nr:hypothetical protein NEDG_01714 [Nematocida displodere]